MDDQLARFLDMRPEEVPNARPAYRHLESIGYDRRFASKLLRGLEGPTPARALDICSGLGTASCHLASLYDCYSVAVEAHPGLSSEAAARFATIDGDRRPSAVVADALRLPFGQRAYFDLIVVSSADGVFGGPAATIARLRSLLPSGGHILVMATVAESEPGSLRLASWIESALSASTGMALGGCRSEDAHLTGPLPKRVISAAQVGVLYRKLWRES